MRLRRDIAMRLVSTVALLAVAGLAVLQSRAQLVWASEQQREAKLAAALVATEMRPGQSPARISGTLRSASAILAEHPLSELPLLRAAVQPGSDGPALRRALANEAVRRNPRSTTGRTWLVADAIRRGDNHGALRQIDRLLALRPQQASSFFRLLAEFARDGGLQDDLARMVKTGSWGPEFLAYLTGTSNDSALVFQLTRSAAAARADKGWVNAQQAQVVQSLIDRGDYDRAYLSWVNFLPAEALGATGLLYDAGFKGLAGPPPFNWRLTRGDAANVQIDSATGLVVDYHGETAAQFAEQVLLLEPRNYRLTYSGSGDPPGDAGKQILLHVYCLPDRTLLAELVIDPEHAGAADFAVPPASCPAQLLAIEGSPGEFPAQRQLRLRQLSLSVREALP